MTLTTTLRGAARLATALLIVHSALPGAGARAQAGAGPDGSVLTAGELGYETTIEAGGRTIDLTASRVLEEASRGGRRMWRLIETTETPRGTSVDTLEMDRGTLRPIRRSAGGAGRMQVHYRPDSIFGTLGAGGRRVGLALDEPVYASGPGLELVVAALPLEPGYEIDLRSAVLQRGEVRVFTLRVTGTREVTVPAGSYETFEVQLEPAEREGSGRMASSTLYVRKGAPHHVVRGTTKMQGGMVTMTKELASLEGGS